MLLCLVHVFAIDLADPRVVEAIHAPTSKNWTATFTLQTGYPFGGGFKGGVLCLLVVLWVGLALIYILSFFFLCAVLLRSKCVYSLESLCAY